MFAPMAAMTITAGVRFSSASIRISYGMTARVAQTDSHARNRAHPARSLMKCVLLAAPNRSGCAPVMRVAEVVKDDLVTTLNRKLRLSWGCRKPQRSVLSIQLSKRLHIVRGKSGGGRAADVIGGLQQLAIVAEVARAVARLPEQVHDVVEVPRVLEAERMPELVERGQVDDDVACQRIDFDRRIRGNVDLRGVDESGRADMRARLAVVAARAVEVDLDSRVGREKRAAHRERAVARGRPRPHRLFDELIALRRQVLPINPDGDCRMRRPMPRRCDTGTRL